MIAGVSSAIVLAMAGVPFSLALGLLVAILDLDPARRARRSPGSSSATVAFLTSITAGVIVVVFFVLYQQLENHVLQPLVYGRTVSSRRSWCCRDPDRRRGGRRARRAGARSPSPARCRSCSSTRFATAAAKPTSRVGGRRRGRRLTLPPSARLARGLS